MQKCVLDVLSMPNFKMLQNSEQKAGVGFDEILLEIFSPSENVENVLELDIQDKDEVLHSVLDYMGFPNGFKNVLTDTGVTENLKFKNTDLLPMTSAETYKNSLESEYVNDKDVSYNSNELDKSMVITKHNSEFINNSEIEKNSPLTQNSKGHINDLEFTIKNEVIKAEGDFDKQYSSNALEKTVHELNKEPVNIRSDLVELKHTDNSEQSTDKQYLYESNMGFSFPKKHLSSAEKTDLKINTNFSYRGKDNQHQDLSSLHKKEKQETEINPQHNIATETVLLPKENNQFVFSEKDIFTQPVAFEDIPAVGEKISLGIKEGKKELSIVLYPEELGRISVKISQQDQGVSANIITDNIKVRDELLKSCPELKECLSAQGVKLVSIDVQFQETTGDGKALLDFGDSGRQNFTRQNQKHRFNHSNQGHKKEMAVSSMIRNTYAEEGSLDYLA